LTVNSASMTKLSTNACFIGASCSMLGGGRPAPAN
jgi:hypothetical protein